MDQHQWSSHLPCAPTKWQLVVVHQQHQCRPSPPGAPLVLLHVLLAPSPHIRHSLKNAPSGRKNVHNMSAEKEGCMGRKPTSVSSIAYIYASITRVHLVRLKATEVVAMVVAYKDALHITHLVKGLEEITAVRLGTYTIVPLAKALLVIVVGINVLVKRNVEEGKSWNHCFIHPMAAARVDCC